MQDIDENLLSSSLDSININDTVEITNPIKMSPEAVTIGVKRKLSVEKKLLLKKHFQTKRPSIQKERVKNWKVSHHHFHLVKMEDKTLRLHSCLPRKKR